MYAFTVFKDSSTKKIDFNLVNEIIRDSKV